TDRGRGDHDRREVKDQPAAHRPPQQPAALEWGDGWRVERLRSLIRGKPHVFISNHERSEPKKRPGKTCPSVFPGWHPRPRHALSLRARAWPTAGYARDLSGWQPVLPAPWSSACRT